MSTVNFYNYEAFLVDTTVYRGDDELSLYLESHTWRYSS